MSEVANPWLPENWNLTAQGEYIKTYGVSVAQRKARQAGTVLGALKPRVSPMFTRNFIIIKKVSDDTSTQGTSGTGPPP